MSTVKTNKNNKLVTTPEVQLLMAKNFVFGSKITLKVLQMKFIFGWNWKCQKMQIWLFWFLAARWSRRSSRNRFYFSPVLYRYVTLKDIIFIHTSFQQSPWNNVLLSYSLLSKVLQWQGTLVGWYFPQILHFHTLYTTSPWYSHIFHSVFLFLFYCCCKPLQQNTTSTNQPNCQTNKEDICRMISTQFPLQQ